MSRKKRTEALRYQIHAIQEVEVHIPILSEALMDSFEEEKLDFSFTFDYLWDTDDDLFSVVVGVVYIYDREHLDEEMLKYTGLVEYRISDLAQYIDTQNKEIKLPIELLAILTGIAISTVRGMIATRTAGKFQGDFYIPILSPMRVVEDYFRMADVVAKGQSN